MRFLASLICIGMCFSAYAVVTDSDELFELSLEELLNVKVNVLSKREDSADSAPGVVTVLTEKDIKQYGAKNLHDLLRLVPAIQHIYPQFTHRSAVAVRGQVAGALDKYFLILLNGKPLRDPMLYGVNAAIYEGIPLATIERIEILRGPGSVMYGSNAVAGVMDIITKKQANNVLSVKAGSYNTRINEVQGSFSGNHISATAAFRGHDSDGWELEFVDTTGNMGKFNNENHADGTFVDINYDNWRFNMLSAQVKEKATLANGRIADHVYRPTDREFYSLGYDADINDSWQIEANLSQNSSDFAATTEYDATDSVAEVLLHGVINDTKVDIGLNINNNSLIDTQGVNVSEVTYKSLFTQATFAFDDDSQMIIGLQVVDPDKSDIQLAPRVSYFKRISADLSYKAIYGKAYASPTGIEFSLEVPGLFFGNRDLVPTTIDNFDFQVNYSGRQYTSAVNVFYSLMQNSIGLENEIPGQALPKRFQNIGDEKHWGLEANGKYIISDKLQVVGSYTFQKSENDAGTTNFNLLSNHMIKTGVNYSANKELNVGIFNIYHSKPHNREPLVNEVNPAEKAYNYLTVNTNYTLKNVWQNNDRLQLNLYIDNALANEPVFLPDPTLTNLNTMPKLAKRSYYLGAEYSF